MIDNIIQSVTEKLSSLPYIAELCCLPTQAASM